MTPRKRVLLVLGFFNQSTLTGFSRYAREANWMLNAFFVLHGNVPKGWRADGMLTTNVFRPDLLRFVATTARQIPTVLHGCNDRGWPIPNVEYNEWEVGRMAAKHLLEMGHKHFAYFQYSHGLHATRRREGFHEQLTAAGRDCINLEKISPDGIGLAEWFERRLARLPRPLGLFAEDDILAARAIDSAIAAGWRVPEDLAIVGVGNISLANDQSEVPITSVSLPDEEGAYRAAAMLDRMLAGSSPGEWTTIFAPTGLIARQSTNSVAARHPVVKRALGWMAANCHDPKLDISAISQGIGVSARLLHKEFQEDVQSSPMAELRRLRIRRARELLLASKEKVETISTECGFANLRTFLRCFEQAEQDSPTRWRRKMGPIERTRQG